MPLQTHQTVRTPEPAASYPRSMSLTFRRMNTLHGKTEYWNEELDWLLKTIDQSFSAMTQFNLPIEIIDSVWYLDAMLRQKLMGAN